MELFFQPQIEDRDRIASYLTKGKQRACDYSPANLILWSGVYHTKIAYVNDWMLIQFGKRQNTCFAWPMGDGDRREIFRWIENYCREQNLPVRFNPVEPEMMDILEELYPGQYEVSYQRDNADYIYRCEDLKNLSGKKYHGKKNYINRFRRLYDNWNYERITDDNTEDCIRMAEEWCRQNACDSSDVGKQEEMCNLIRGLENREALRMKGGLIRIDGRVVAMTLGEAIQSDTFIIHYEKAFSDIPGAYTMINQQFIEHELAAFTYVNREEDLGLPGLRKAKESYRPVSMVEKGIARKK